MPVGMPYLWNHDSLSCSPRHPPRLRRLAGPPPAMSPLHADSDVAMLLPMSPRTGQMSLQLPKIEQPRGSQSARAHVRHRRGRATPRELDDQPTGGKLVEQWSYRSPFEEHQARVAAAKAERAAARKEFLAVQARAAEAQARMAEAQQRMVDAKARMVELKRKQESGELKPEEKAELQAAETTLKAAEATLKAAEATLTASEATMAKLDAEITRLTQIEAAPPHPPSPPRAPKGPMGNVMQRSSVNTKGLTPDEAISARAAELAAHITELAAKNAELLAKKDQEIEKWIHSFVVANGLEDVFNSLPTAEHERTTLRLEASQGTKQVRGLVQQTLDEYHEQDARSQELDAQLGAVHAIALECAAYEGRSSATRDALSERLNLEFEKVRLSLGPSIVADYAVARHEGASTLGIDRLVNTQRQFFTRFGEQLELDLKSLQLPPRISPAVAIERLAAATERYNSQHVDDAGSMDGTSASRLQLNGRGSALSARPQLAAMPVPQQPILPAPQQPILPAPPNSPAPRPSRGEPRPGDEPRPSTRGEGEKFTAAAALHAGPFTATDAATLHAGSAHLPRPTPPSRSGRGAARGLPYFVLPKYVPPRPSNLADGPDRTPGGRGSLQPNELDIGLAGRQGSEAELSLAAGMIWPLKPPGPPPAFQADSMCSAPTPTGSASPATPYWQRSEDTLLVPYRCASREQSGRSASSGGAQGPLSPGGGSALIAAPAAGVAPGAAIVAAATTDPDHLHVHGFERVSGPCSVQL